MILGDTKVSFYYETTMLITSSNMMRSLFAYPLSGNSCCSNVTCEIVLGNFKNLKRRGSKSKLKHE